MRIYSSDRPTKRYKVKYNNKWVHFGSRDGSTYIDHQNQQLKNAWLARHSKLSNFSDPSKPSFWSRYILWNKKTLSSSIQDVRNRIKN